jgi:DNA-binding NtrC family response regulator
MSRILVVDDEPNLREAIRYVLLARGYTVDAVGSGEQAVVEHRQQPYDLVILDISLPGISGLTTLAQLRAITPGLMAVFITAFGSIASAVEAIRSGGFDYLTKPFDNEDVVLTVERALEHRRLTARVQELEADLAARTNFVGIVGTSTALQEAVRRIARVARADTTVLLSGETGTGKELAARTVHRSSDRASGPFIAINCGAISSTLAESELFGHERGAYTDAKTERRGPFELAEKGTVFLDEVGELSSELQVKLLRVLQEREVVRVGGNRAIPVDIRVVAATNRDLAQDVRSGRFREDLFWRLNVFSIEMPPLRDRPEDIPLLVSYLLDRVNAECRSRVAELAPEVSEVFTRHAWPGNVRELANVLRHAAIMVDGSVVKYSDLPPYLMRDRAAESHPDGVTLDAALADTERRLIAATLRRFQGHRRAAAVALGISRRTLYNKMVAHGLPVSGDDTDSKS